MTLPNFLIIGAAKSGTSSLYKYLSAHPEIFVPDFKEPSFFSWEDNRPCHRGPGDKGADGGVVCDRSAYEAMLDPVSAEKAFGDASVNYIYYPWAAENIHRTIPGVRLIVVLRNPVERAYSSFMPLVRDGRETTDDFNRGLALEEERLRDNWQPLWAYKDAGLYRQQLEHYYRLFPLAQIRVYLYEDLSKDPGSMLRDIYRFLGVDDSFEGDTATCHNVSGVTRSRFLTQMIRRRSVLKAVYQRVVPLGTRRKLTARLKEWNVSKVAMPEDARQQLVAAFRDDIVKLEELIRRVLSHWRT